LDHCSTHATTPNRICSAQKIRFSLPAEPTSLRRTGVRRQQRPPLSSASSFVPNGISVVIFIIVFICFIIHIIIRSDYFLHGNNGN
jgi:hypothetical protein